MISDTGALMGILAPQGRLLNKSKGAGFVAQNWLQNDGDGRQQSQVALGWKLTFGDMEWVHIPGKKAARAATDCHRNQVVIATVDFMSRGDCLILDAAVFAVTGSIDIVSDAGRLRVRTAQSYSGNRLWSPVTVTAATALDLAQKMKQLTVLLNSSGLGPLNAPVP